MPGQAGASGDGVRAAEGQKDRGNVDAERHSGAGRTGTFEHTEAASDIPFNHLLLALTKETSKCVSS
jgi:hypothetical protein